MMGKFASAAGASCRCRSVLQEWREHTEKIGGAVQEGVGARIFINGNLICSTSMLYRQHGVASCQAAVQRRGGCRAGAGAGGQQGRSTLPRSRLGKEKKSLHELAESHVQVLT